MKIAWLIWGMVAMVGPCWAKPRLQHVQLTLRYEMKNSLRSLPASITRVQNQSRFTLTVSDSFYALSDSDSSLSTSFEPLASRPRLWQGEFQVSGQTNITDKEQHFLSIVKGGRALKKSEMPGLVLSPALMGVGKSIACQFDFPVKLNAQTVVSGANGETTTTVALPGATPPCLESRADATVFSQTIEANPPLSRRPQDAFGARTYDGWKDLQKRGEFWLSSPTFFELQHPKLGLYTLTQNRAFRFKPSKTESQSWTQSLTLKLTISPA